MTVYKDHVFNGDVQLDGNVFVNCTFESVRFIYDGGELPTLSDASFKGAPPGMMLGDAAERTILLLRMFYGAGIKTPAQSFIDIITGAAQPRGLSQPSAH